MSTLNCCEVFFKSRCIQMSTERSDVILSKMIGHLVEMFEGLNKFISCR